MQIGEFALLCNTKISVLRHYDKEGLLKPDYIDDMTGYRYYSEEQVADFLTIGILKEAGFSLAQIRSIIRGNVEKDELRYVFDEKKKELKEALLKLDKAKSMMDDSIGINLCRCEDKTVAQILFDYPQLFDEKCSELEIWLLRGGYQRISHFTMKSGEGGYSASCTVLKLSDRFIPAHDDAVLEFENDPMVVGKWQAVGEFAVREDFFSGKGFENMNDGTTPDIIFFLPGGENYWSFGWTKGFLIIESGLGYRTINRYTVELVGMQRYMFVEHKSYNYCRDGAETVLVLRQLDNISYSKEQIAKKDDMNLPFVNDPSVIGKWRVVGFVPEKDIFYPDKVFEIPLLYKSIDFYENGIVKSTFLNGGVIDSPNAQSWTAGYVLQKLDFCSCAYEIRTLKGRDYLFLEWKSGDYVYGRKKPKYYVFEKECK